MFEAFFYRASNACLLIRRDLTILDANREALRTIRRERQALVGRSVGELLDRAELQHLLENAELIDGWTPSRILQSTFGDGKETEVRVISLRPESGEPQFAVKLLGEELRRRTFHRLREDLLNTRERAEREEHLRRELEHTNAKLKVFAHRISHDLRSPLRNMKLLLDYYIEDLPDGEEVPDLLRHARDVSVNLEQVVASLLEYSKSTARSVNKSRCSLDNIVREASRQAFGQPDDQVLEVGALPDILADHDLVEIVFQNLFANSLKFRSSDRKLRVQVQAVQHETGVTLLVKDNGIGFKPEDAERIFQMFARAHSHVEGSGIGLATCADIVNSHGWTVTADGQPGEGAVFSIEIPAADICNHPGGGCGPADC